MAVVFHITCKHCGETADYDSWLATHEQILPFTQEQWGLWVTSKPKRIAELRQLLDRMVVFLADPSLSDKDRKGYAREVDRLIAQIKKEIVAWPVTVTVHRGEA